MRLRQFRKAAVLLGIAATLVLVVAIRLQRATIWFPPAPATIGEWSLTEVPLDRATLELLGSPPADGYRYTNPFGEVVDSHVISAVTYSAYHEPLICMSGYGYEKTALKTMYPFGPGRPVRALVLKSLTSGNRVLMYYWVQYKDGSTGLENELALHQDLVPRFAVGLEKTLRSQPSCIVRAYILVHPADRLGLQARRDLETVCLGLYTALQKNGAGSR